MAQERDIKYINREFTDFKDQLVQYAKNYFPDTYNDFSPTSPGTMFIEMAAYVGDVLSFYQDTQLQETYLQYAKEPGNLYNLAYMLGYKPKVSTISEVELSVSHRVGKTSNYNPDYSQALSIDANAIIGASVNGDINFIIDRKIDFGVSSSYDPTEVRIASLDGDGNPAEYTLTKKVKATSGTVKTVTETIGAAEQFLTITVDDEKIIRVLDITDGDGKVYNEVPFLGQDTIFEEVSNEGTDSTTVPYLLSATRVPRRFVTRFNSSGQLLIQFGSGITGQLDTDFLPDPSNVGIGSTDKVSTIDKNYDPNNFLYSSAYGIAPSDTTLTIRYLVGGGVESNVPANTVVNQKTVVTQAEADPTVVSSLSFTNLQPATGGRDGDTVEELRENSRRAFAEQGRAVTLQDYSFRALTLPSQFGSIAKAYVTQDQLVSRNSATDNIIDSNPLALSMYVLAFDGNKKVVNATSNLKENLKTYISQYKMITDAISIKDAFVVNIGINFDIMIRPNYNGRDVLLNCTNELKDFFDIAKWSINQPINLSLIYTLLDRVKGVQTVENIEVVNKQGGIYSKYAYDVKGATKRNVVYPSYDPMIFEVKYPNSDIKGRITTL